MQKWGYSNKWRRNTLSYTLYLLFVVSASWILCLLVLKSLVLNGNDCFSKFYNRHVILLEIRTSSWTRSHHLIFYGPWSFKSYPCAVFFLYCNKCLSVFEWVTNVFNVKQYSTNRLDSCQSAPHKSAFRFGQLHIYTHTLTKLLFLVMELAKLIGKRISILHWTG